MDKKLLLECELKDFVISCSCIPNLSVCKTDREVRIVVKSWLRVFVSWCLAQAGEGESAGGAFASCSLWIAALRELGQYTARSAHTPRMGDLIFFRSSGVSRASDHVGLVLDVRGGRVYTVEGNSSEQVALRSYALSDTYIVGYGRPDYENKGESISRRTHEDRSAGYYVVSYDFLNVRATTSASGAKKGQLAKGIA